MFFSNKSGIFLIMIILIMLMSISSIHASDLDNTTVENKRITITDNLIGNNTCENPPGTFDDLKEDISHLSLGDVFNVTRNYHFTGSKTDPDGENRGIIISVKNITINGNGHIIDGNHQSAFFRIESDYVKIFNLIFINGEYHGKTVKISAYPNYDYSNMVTYYYTDDVSPIDWIGYGGVISNCIFRENTATNGAAITWDGNCGLISNTVFLNNIARGVGGAVYVKGKNSTIQNSIFINSTSILSGEAIYLDAYQENNNISSIFAKCIPIIDGKTTKIDVDFLHYSYESIVGDKRIDLLKAIYSSITNNYTHYYDDNTIFFSGFNGTDFVLNFARSFDELEIIYGKTYHFTKISNYNDVFLAVLREDFKNEITYIKNIQVHNQNDYENAIIATDSVFTIDSFVKYIAEDLTSMKSYTTYKELLVTFAGQYKFDSKSTWRISDAFDMIRINGNGSRITIESDYNDEFKWAVLNDTKCILSVCNLIIERFNMAIENIGGTCIFNNVTFNLNRMDYCFEQDYGAAICNTGTCVCNNCTFTNNYCKYGGAIFSQGALEVNNCTFKGNYAYKHGENIFNADEGIIKVNNVTIKNTQGLVYHDTSISKKQITVLYFISAGLAAAVGFTIGTIFGSPVLGTVIGAIAGTAVGIGSAAYICSHVYNLNFDRTTLCVCFIIGCAAAGAAGGALGGYLTAVPEDWVEPAYELYSENVYLVSSESSSVTAAETGSVISDSQIMIELDSLSLDERTLEEILMQLHV